MAKEPRPSKEDTADPGALTLEEKIDALPDDEPIKEILEMIVERIKAPPIPVGRRP